MGLTTKIILVVGIAAYLYRENIFGTEKLTELPSVSTHIGKAVSSPGSSIIYKINTRGLKVAYENEQAWINDGSPEFVELSDAELNALGEITNAMYFEIGGYRQY